ncbi:MAG: hypothetical protein QM757_33665 [Paludibaculum sp.]
MAALLLLSGGVPMILAGDEMARTQGGNNNAYCQDNATSWVDWTWTESNSDMVEFFRRMIAFRASREAFRRRLGPAGRGTAHPRHLSRCVSRMHRTGDPIPTPSPSSWNGAANA